MSPGRPANAWWMTDHIPSAGPPGPRRRLTVGMATYGDYDGAYFTSAAVRMYHREVADDVSILVVDNDPRGPAAWALKALEKEIEGLRYFPADDITSAAVKDRVVREANSDWVLVVDSHVLIVPGALARLLDLIDAHPDCDDLLQGPLLTHAGHYMSQRPGWLHDLYGVWGESAIRPGLPDPDAAPVDIEIQGLGLFACRKDSWPGYSPLFRGHGAEEGYLHAKYRALGRRTRCLPFLGWQHRFGRPLDIPYANSMDDRIRNYLIAAEEVGYPSTWEVLDHFRDQARLAGTDDIVRRWEREKRSPLAFFEVIAVWNPQRDEDRWRRVHDDVASAFGVEKRLRRITLPPVSVADPHDRGRADQVSRALCHRHLVARAVNEGWRRLLVIDDDVTVRRWAGAALSTSLVELQHDSAWMMLDLSAGGNGDTSQEAYGATGPVAVAYQERAYAALLAALPDDPVTMGEALGAAGGSLRQLLRSVLPVSGQRVLTSSGRSRSGAELLV